MSNETNEYAWSFDEELYHGQEPSIEAAIAEALAEAEDSKHTAFWIGKCKRFAPSKISGWIIEQLQEQAYDDCGEFAESYLDDVTDAEAAELDSLVLGWAERVDRSNFYTIKEPQRFTIEEAREYLAKATGSAQ